MSMAPAAPVTAYIGLGGNLGDAAATVRAAAAELAETAGVGSCALSPLYRSAPVDTTGPDFINAVARIETTLAPLDLLDALQAMETHHGRQRPYYHAPRTLDLDLLLYGDVHMNDPRLILPHPRMHERAFVLRPLADLAPALALPQGELDTLLSRCAAQAVERLEH
jgi:2-amino-4-hydroxy-6-hydroxymethyldihydropteridine diphosphokinase